MTPPRLLKTKNCRKKLMFKAMFEVSVYLPRYQSPKIKIIVDIQRKTFMPESLLIYKTLEKYISL